MNLLCWWYALRLQFNANVYLNRIRRHHIFYSQLKSLKKNLFFFRQEKIEFDDFRWPHLTKNLASVTWPDRHEVPFVVGVEKMAAIWFFVVGITCKTARKTIMDWTSRLVAVDISVTLKWIGAKVVWKYRERETKQPILLPSFFSEEKIRFSCSRHKWMTMSANTWTNSSTLWVIAVIVFILQPANSHNSGN